MLQMDTGFEQHLGDHRLSDIDAESGSVIGLWPDGSIGLLNSSWRRFAEENDGAGVVQRWPLGSDLLSGVSGVLRDYYSRALARVRRHGEPWEQSYQCPSPGAARHFRMRVLPLANGSLLLVHTRVVGAEHGPSETDSSASGRDPPSGDLPSGDPPDPADYVGPRGMIRQCSNCRRTQRAHRHEWDWVTAHVMDPPRNISHGICPICIRQDYPEL